MQHDGPSVALRADKMDGGPGQLDAVGQGLLVDVEAIAARSGEGGNQGGVDVQNGVGEGLDHLLGEDGHKPGQHHQLDVQLTELVHQGHGHSPVGGIVLPGEDIAGDARLFGPLQGIGLGGGGNHGGDGAVYDLAPALGIDEGLKIGPAAGDQHGDALHHTSSTPSAPATTSPMA